MTFNASNKVQYRHTVAMPTARVHLDRITWEDDVYEAMTFALDVTRSDAQSISEAVPDAIEHAWMNDYAPDATVRYIEALNTSQAQAARPLSP